MNRLGPQADQTRMDQMNGNGAEVRLYTLPGCAACVVARRLLRRRGISFEEVRGDGIPDFRRMLLRRTGGATVPQVLIDGRPIGGADSLIALDRSGVLLPKVRRQPFPVVVIQRRFALLRRRYEVRVVDADAKVLVTAQAGSMEEAESMAIGLRSEFGD
jgi:glutaredoxin 3